MHTGSLEYTKRYLEQGFDMVMLGADMGFMSRMASMELQAARNDTGTDRVKPGEDYS